LVEGYEGYRWERALQEDDDRVMNETELTEDATRLIALERRLLRVEDNEANRCV
jgi:hypothetical protein